MAVTYEGMPKQRSARGTSAAANLNKKGGQTRMRRTLANLRNALGDGAVKTAMKTWRIRSAGGGKYAGKNG